MRGLDGGGGPGVLFLLAAGGGGGAPGQKGGDAPGQDVSLATAAPQAPLRVVWEDAGALEDLVRWTFPNDNDAPAQGLAQVPRATAAVSSF